MVATQPGALAPYTPRISVEWDLDAPGTTWQVVDGSLVFVDISGFTALSERLARLGRIGAEELTAVLDTVFGAMLRAAYARGGSLLKFGGDALLLLFESPDHVLQATAAAVEVAGVDVPADVAVEAVLTARTLTLQTRDTQQVLATWDLTDPNLRVAGERTSTPPPSGRGTS